MEEKSNRMAELIALVKKNTWKDGRNMTGIPSMELYRQSKPNAPQLQIYDPYFIFIVQGRKQIVLENNIYECNAGHFLTTLAPMPVKCKVVEVCGEKTTIGNFNPCKSPENTQHPNENAGTAFNQTQRNKSLWDFYRSDE